jgi:hypothetical protein
MLDRSEPLADPDNQEDEITIMVSTCDAYHDVLPLFFAALDEYWPKPRFPVVINTENLRPICIASDIRVHTLPEARGWGDRLNATLDSISTKYVIALLDDFVLEAPVSVESILEARRLMDEDERISVVYLLNPNLRTQPSEHDPLFAQIPDYAAFRLNTAPGLWRIQHLKKLTHPTDNPWAWEVFGTYRTYNSGKLFLCISPHHSSVYTYSHAKGGAIYRGRWVRSVVDNKLIKYGLNIDLGIRGCADMTAASGRGIIWAVKFVATGYDMVGMKIGWFFLHYLKAKLRIPC